MVAGEEVVPEKEAKDEKTVANGYFKDADVKDRELSDYTGEWQSVYPLLKDGILDEVFDYKAKLNKDMTAAEYKDYYTTGYKTDIDTINIKDNTIDFVVNGEHHQYTYKYVGYKILNYEKETVVFVLILKLMMQVLVVLNIFNLAIMELHQVRQSISIFSLVEKVKKNFIMKCIIGLLSIQLHYLSMRLLKK